MSSLVDIDSLWLFLGLGWSLRAEILPQLTKTESTSTSQGVAKQSLTCKSKSPDAGGLIPMLRAQSGVRCPGSKLPLFRGTPWC